MYYRGDYMDLIYYICKRNKTVGEEKYKEELTNFILMENNIHIIEALTSNETDTIESLAHTIWNEHYSSILSKQQIEYMTSRFQSAAAINAQIKDGNCSYFLLYKDSLQNAVGYIGVKFEEENLFLSKLYILKSTRGTGAGRMAFEFLKSLALEKNLRKIWLTVNKYNKDTIKIYEHLGFAITREQVADIGNGYVMDDYIMEYNLENHKI